MQAYMRVVRMPSMCSIVVLGCVLTYRKVCDEHSSIKMRVSSQLKEFRIELIEATINRWILAIRIVKHIGTAFERREVPRRGIRMALD